MSREVNYAEVGFICGLEVHQQLLTERKLFCRCPAATYTREHDGTVLRHMRPTLSELGEYDGTALMEKKTRKNIVYLLNQRNVCTYEMDDTPPFLMNPKALDVAIEQCLMLGCDIVDEVHIARKQYLDGSIPTGFQRTAIVGVGGKLPFRGRELSITQVSVEEDSCREVSDRGHLIIWRADRLGTPLIETVTGPDLRTPDEVAEAILLIGRVCRSTGHVRVGLGASRQDINVSVRGGRRVEIKGVPQAGWAPALVHGEAIRQLNLLDLAADLHQRGFDKPGTIVAEEHDVTELFAGSRLELLRADAFERFVDADDRRRGYEMLEGRFCVRAVRLPGLAGTLSWPGQPGLTFAHELAGRIRVIACLDQQPILLHSEKWPDYEGAKQELERLKKRTGCRPEDGLVVIWGIEPDTVRAADEIRLRYEDAIEGVPNETRQPFADGSTHFERILPGPDRMYPDTDSPPQRVTRDRAERLRAALPPPPWERERRYAEVGVPRATVHYLIRRGAAALVDRVVEKSAADLRQACFFFGERLKALRRQGIAVEQITPEAWERFFELARSRPVLFEAAGRIVAAMARHPDRDVAALVTALELGEEPGDWKALVLDRVRNVKLARPVRSPAALLRHLAGLCMRRLRGCVPARQVIAVVRQQMEANR